MGTRLSELATSKRFATIARAFLGIVILAAMLRYIDLERFASTLGQLSPGYALGMLLVAVVGRLLRAWKWNLLLRAKNIRISTWDALQMSLVGHFTGSWTPGQIGGDAYRLFALRRFQDSEAVLSTLLLERYAGLWAVSCFVVIGLPATLPQLLRVSPWLVPALIALLLLVLAIIPCMFSLRVIDLLVRILPPLRGSSIEKKLRSFYQAVADFRHHGGVLWLFASAAIAEVTSYFFLNFLCARSLGLDVSLVFFLFAMPVVHLLLRVPISVQALGVQEGCFAYALVIHGFEAADGLAVSVVQRILEWIVSIVPGGLLLILNPGSSRASSMEHSASGPGH